MNYISHKIILFRTHTHLQINTQKVAPKQIQTPKQWERLECSSNIKIFHFNDIFISIQGEARRNASVVGIIHRSCNLKAPPNEW